MVKMDNIFDANLKHNFVISLCQSLVVLFLINPLTNKSVYFIADGADEFKANDPFDFGRCVCWFLLLRLFCLLYIFHTRGVV